MSTATITQTRTIGSMTVTTIHSAVWGKSMELAGGDRKRLVLTETGIIVANSREHADTIRANIRYGTVSTVTPERVTKPAKSLRSSDTVTIVKTLHGISREYRLTGRVNGEEFTSQLARKSKTADYTHASLTTIPLRTAPQDGPTTSEVLSFHKSRAAALKGAPNFGSVKLSVRVITITEE